MFLWLEIAVPGGENAEKSSESGKGVSWAILAQPRQRKNLLLLGSVRVFGLCFGRLW